MDSIREALVKEGTLKKLDANFDRDQEQIRE